MVQPQLSVSHLPLLTSKYMFCSQGALPVRGIWYDWSWSYSTTLCNLAPHVHFARGQFRPHPQQTVPTQQNVTWHSPNCKSNHIKTQIETNIQKYTLLKKCQILRHGTNKRPQRRNLQQCTLLVVGGSLEVSDIFVLHGRPAHSTIGLALNFATTMSTPHDANELHGMPPNMKTSRWMKNLWTQIA